MEQRLSWQTPVGVKKMGLDAGDKFFLDYWQWEEDSTQAISPAASSDIDLRRSQYFAQFDQCVNVSVEMALRPAYLHQVPESDAMARLFGRQLSGRAFQCPSGTNDCSSIGRSGYCCDSGETCVLEGSNVGCCPAGESCGSTIAGCDTAAGYTSCNNGCCIPGSSCTSGGCVIYGTRTVTTTLPVVTITTGTLSTSTSTTSSSTPVPVVVSTPYTTTVTISGSTVTTTVVSATTVFVSTCTLGYFSCPSSLGGGCCPNGQSCASGTQCLNPSTTSTVSASAAILPTSVSSSPGTSLSVADTSATSTTTVTACPVGYYMCSAVYLGGCCQVGRNCDTMSCPAVATTTIVSNSEATIATTGPKSDTAVTVTQGSCASGWGLCPASVGGGCCPLGYLCSSNCIATVAGVGNQTKEAPSAATVQRFTWSFLALGVAAAFGMIFL